MTSTTAPKTTGIIHRETTFDAVEKLFKSEILRCKRDYVEGAHRAKFLGKELTQDQLVFNSAKVGRKHWLVDGGRRVEAVLQGKVARPAKILLLTHKCEDEAAVFRLHDQLNSPQSVRTGRDSVQGGLRMTGLLGALNSQLIAAGPLTSATRLATGIRDARDATEKTAKAILFIDRLDLSRQNVSRGVLGAFLAIANHEPDRNIAEQFIRAVQMPFFQPVTDEDGYIVDVRDNQARHRANGSSRYIGLVLGLRDSTLTSYLHYRAAVKKVPKNARKAFAAEVSLGSFIDAMKLLSK